MGAVLRIWKRRSAGLALAMPLAGCVYPMPAERVGDTGAPPGGGPSTYDVRGGGVQDGNFATVRDLRVSSPIYSDPAAFFVQDPAGGPYSGLKVQVAAGVDLPALAVGEVVTVSGTVQLQGGRYELWLTRASGLIRQGQGTLEVEVFDELPERWEPWLGAAVGLPGLTVTGCPDAAGGAPTQAALDLGGPWLAESPGFGDEYVGLTGVVADSAGALALWPRSPQEAGIRTPGDGCSQPIATLRSLGLTGQITVPEAVLTATVDRFGEGYAQDASGAAAGAGLLIRGLSTGALGDEGALSGLLDNEDSRLILTVSQPPDLIPGPPPAALDLTAPEARHIGSLVRFSAVEVGAAGPYGSFGTDAGLSISADRLRPLPLTPGEQLVAVVGLLDRWPDGTWVLLPRGPEDLYR